jgi:hypothetical protein
MLNFYGMNTYLTLVVVYINKNLGGLPDAGNGLKGMAVS